ncbi:DEAD/DEAH box helicase [Aliarcobacter cryaerophilus ATCC 43158]|uniref:DEAD-box ATP-dependent RNA helicase n=1 Tax=Aliarcobacter cryaerophilus ATCC 43158 TaxID=1032070 RepID=A0AAD0XB73_9BACT|nr:DEAD/DEAH box helicase [Aliarcobacter cryaerophilus]AYJ81071.1 DEAD-box ATP-dependent RNA helicase [Aliarcobacter cryaerophilus ATCC 43158]PRM98070.1 DEAD/DEAH box helicase [Aliarcobacter cryaerophilus]QCZ23388.1 DEAD/DEAH box helicase [Aliarcobacter cryaerophilus ATCC 43158]
MTFQDFKFKENLQKAIDEAGFKEPSPIQIDAIPHILLGKDIVGQAHTGTGKTAAFGLPVLNQLTGKNAEAVVIVPTRELAMQVSDELFKFGKFLGINTATVYGGQAYARQLKLIETASVIVATPGRFLDLLKNGHIKIKPKFVILDEADEMLDMGFLDDIKEIFTYLPDDRQTLLFSATMPVAIKNLAKTILKEPEFVTITKSDVTNKNITQTFYVVDERERDDALIRLFDYKNPKKSIIFCRTKKDVDRLSTFLLSQGFMAKSLHGDMEQKQREEAIKAFKTSKLEILIATDVAARGLDVNDVTHVFNYHLPFDGESYVHRIGRTGRAGKDGVAISIVTPHEFRTLQRIEKTIGAKLESKVIPNISTVKQKKIDELKQSILDQEIKDYAITIIEELKEEFDISTIAFKLASIIASKTYVKGNNNIGKSESDISRLIENMSRSSDRGDDRRGPPRGRGRSGGGQRRDSGSRDDRGGQRKPSTSRNSSSRDTNKDSADKPARSSRPRRRD